MEKLVLIIRKEWAILITIRVPLWEMMIQKQIACFKWFVVNKGQNLLLLNCIFDYLAPDICVSTLTEQ